MTNLPANPNSLMPNRQPIDANTLYQMVDDLLAQWTQQQKEFTAWEATIELRVTNPTLEIPHAMGVQERVHFTMSQRADYIVEWRDYNGIDARCYIPQPSLTIDTTADAADLVVPSLTPLPSALNVKQVGPGVFMTFTDEE